MDKELRVKQANRIFFDTVADIYEVIDGRRSIESSYWLKDILRNLSLRTKGESLLDLGCGSGFILRSGKRFFEKTHGIDISFKILKECGPQDYRLICADTDFLPFKDNYFDVVSCFAVLHHCYDHLAIFKEVYRVLKKRGIFYTDHDLDRKFMQRFYLPMLVYRSLFDMRRRYLKAKKELTQEIYDLSEYHAKGIEVDKLVLQLKKTGFSKIEVRYHWLGLNKFFNFITIRSLPRGLAPLCSIIAEK